MDGNKIKNYFGNIFILLLMLFFQTSLQKCTLKNFQIFFLGFRQRRRLRCSPHGRVDRVPRHEADDARRPTQQHLRHVNDFKNFNLLGVAFK